MIALKEGFPQENEIVICTVTSIQYHSVFVRLDEYKHKSGMIHISEISPGRIRNLNDYVKEGKVIVCKVLKINRERGHIDLSLRRVNENQRREKINSMKQEQIAEKIIEFVAKHHSKDPKALYLEIFKTLSAKGYETVYEFFEEIIDESSAIDELALDEAISAEMLDVIRQRIKPAEVVITGDLTLVTYEPDGVSLIKSAFEEAEKMEHVTVSFKGGGKYGFLVVDSNYKDAESRLKQAVDSVTKHLQKTQTEFSFARAK